MSSTPRKLRRRLTAFGLAIVASLAFAGLAAGSASALSYEPSTGKYPAELSISHTGAEFEFSSGAKISCWTKFGGSGAFTSGTAGVLTLGFKGCETQFGWSKCKTPGKAEGEIVTKLLTGNLIYLNAAHTEYGLFLKGPEGTFATFTCGVGTHTITGSVILEITSPLNVSISSIASRTHALSDPVYLFESGYFPGLSDASWGGVTLIAPSVTMTPPAGPGKFIP